MSLELKNVEKKVGIETHIYPTTIKLEKNTINVLLGSTLAGKTTLMQIMAGLDKPTSGEIWFDGKNVTGMKVQKRNCSMVYQQFINYPNYTVYENIASPLAITVLPSVYSRIAPLVKVAFVLRTIFKDTVDESNKPVSSNVPPRILLSTINLPSSTSPTAVPVTPVDG